jgi:predicted DsbA family dithiol-disulfide isomerase
VELEIWSDIACPWCYIGKRRLEAALAEFEHRDDLHIRWRSFELDPDAPAEIEGDRAERLARKYGITVERAHEIGRHLTEVAAGEGLSFRFELARSGSTFDAHRVVHLAAEHELQDAMKERLLRAYLSEGRLMSDGDTLILLAVEVGLPADETREMLAGERFVEDVRSDERAATRIGISAVPTFVIDRAIGLSGAQPPAEILALLRTGWERAGAAPRVVSPAG